MWKTGTKLIRPESPEMGIGVVIAIEGRFVQALFPEAGERIRLVAGAPGTVAVTISVGQLVRDPTTGERATVRSLAGDQALLDNGRRFGVSELWPIVEPRGALQRLAAGDVDAFGDVANRLDGLYLEQLRRAGVIASLAGGRIAIYPHQLATAARAIGDARVRWLLADEVGLGKTVVACLITAALIRMGRVGKAVVVAPDTLTVQWLGELYRKFHTIFTQIDDVRIETVASEFGTEMNPFDAHRMSVVSYELLTVQPALVEAIGAAGPDLVVLDEAHRLLDPTVAPGLLDVARSAPNALLLTTAPFQLGTSGFDRLAAVLDLPRRELGSGRVAVGRVSAVGRAEVPGLPRRNARTIVLLSFGAWNDPTEPRVCWLRDATRRWAKQGRKALAFVNSTAAARAVVKALGPEFADTFVFHDEMDTGMRDLALARFRRSSWPLMISTGAGSEGRNFQFVDHLVHLELPDDPTVLEQRIGRVDRIGRSEEIDIVTFRAPDASASLVDAWNRIGLLSDVIVGASPALEPVRVFLRDHRPGDAGWDEVVEATAVAVRAADETRAWLFVDSYDADMAADVLAAIPTDLEERLLRFCESAAERVGVDCADKGGKARRYFEVDSGLRVDSIPGVPHGARYLGTFDRDEAIENIDVDFFANGHALVEGLIAELADSSRGRVGVVRWVPPDGIGDVLVYETDAGMIGCISLGGAGDSLDVHAVLEAATRTARAVDDDDVEVPSGVAPGGVVTAIALLR